jgi:hypothetical protein
MEPCNALKGFVDNRRSGWLSKTGIANAVSPSTEVCSWDKGANVRKNRCALFAAMPWNPARVQYLAQMMMTSMPPVGEMLKAEGHERQRKSPGNCALITLLDGSAKNWCETVLQPQEWRLDPAIRCKCENQRNDKTHCLCCQQLATPDGMKNAQR